MRAVVQRVENSCVRVNESIVGKIEKGLNVLLGIEGSDDQGDVEYMVDKIVNLRIFEDAGGKMNFSVRDVGGEVLVVSQFTLIGDCRKGRRPNFMKAAKPPHSEKLYEKLCEKISNEFDIPVKTGSFKQHMKVEILNDGPVTLLLDSKKNF